MLGIASSLPEVPRPARRTRHHCTGLPQTASATSSAASPSRERMFRARGRRKRGMNSASDRREVAHCGRHVRHEMSLGVNECGPAPVPAHTDELSQSFLSCSNSCPHCSLHSCSTVRHGSDSNKADPSHGGRGLKTRTAPRRIRQRCCPLLVRYVDTLSMGKTPTGADPGPTAATRLVTSGL